MDKGQDMTWEFVVRIETLRLSQPAKAGFIFLHEGTSTSVSAGHVRAKPHLMGGGGSMDRQLGAHKTWHLT